MKRAYVLTALAAAVVVLVVLIRTGEQTDRQLPPPAASSDPADPSTNDHGIPATEPEPSLYAVAAGAPDTLPLIPSKWMEDAKDAERQPESQAPSRFDR